MENQVETQGPSPDRLQAIINELGPEKLRALMDAQRGPRKIFSYGNSLVESWLYVWEKYHTLEYPYAHKGQRLMTYPHEDPKSLWQLINSIYLLCFMGNQGGKSVWDSAWVIMECLGIHPLQKLTWRKAMEMCDINVDDLKDRPFKDIDQTIRHAPPMEWWVIAPELPAEARIPGGEDTPLVKTYYEWTPPDALQFFRKDKIMLIGKSSIKWKGHEQETKRFAGDRIDGASFDEIPPLRVWNETKPRIMKKRGIFLLGMTPDYTSKWTAEVMLSERENTDYYIRELDAGDNPFMDMQYRERVLGSLNDEEKLMRMQGRHVQFMGLAFPNFNRNENVSKPFEVTNANYNVLVCDWHPVKPIAISYVSINPRNYWYVWDESWIKSHIIDEIANEIYSKLKYRGNDGLYINLMMRHYYIDAIAQTKQIQKGRRDPISIVDMFKPLGIRFEPMAWGKNDNWESSRVAIDRRFKVRELYIDPSCTNHIRQLSTWGVKRYSHGDLEGVARDIFEAEDDDCCVNLMYVQHARTQFEPVQKQDPNDTWLPPRKSTSNIYGRRAEPEMEFYDKDEWERRVNNARLRRQL